MSTDKRGAFATEQDGTPRMRLRTVGVTTAAYSPSAWGDTTLQDSGLSRHDVLICEAFSPDAEDSSDDVQEC